MRILVVPLLVAGLLVGFVSFGLSRYARRHFIPQQQMTAALAAGDGCVLFLGDSRMAAAFEPATFHRALQATGTDRCHAQLAIGGTQIAGAYLTAREYLARGRRPSVVVIGKVGDSLLGPVEPLRPEEMVGHNAIQLIWSDPSDVFEVVPGFPAASVNAFDRGFRFLIGRATAFGRYQSLITARVQQLQTALVGGEATPRNDFGALSDMANLEAGLRARAPARLAAAMAGSPEDRYGQWFAQIAALFRARQIPMLLVELPMMHHYRQTVTDTPEAEAYEAWLAAEMERHGDAFLDLSGDPWLDDSLFRDGLHVKGQAVVNVSSEIGARLGAFLEARRANDVTTPSPAR